MSTVPMISPDITRVRECFAKPLHPHGRMVSSFVGVGGQWCQRMVSAHTCLGRQESTLTYYRRSGCYLCWWAIVDELGT